VGLLAGVLLGLTGDDLGAGQDTEVVLGQISSTPVGFVTAKGSPVAKALSDAVNKLISDGDYAKILAKWGVTSSGTPASAVNPKPTL
jgi:polar amino acid transport system substrate-binding protein